MKNTALLNTVETVFSKDAVAILESFLYDYWNDFYGMGFVDEIMSMLTMYIKHYSYGSDDRWYKKPDGMCEFVSKIIQLNDRLNELTRDEHPCHWVDTNDGWRLPMRDKQN